MRAISSGEIYGDVTPRNGSDVYDKHIRGTWGYGYCYKSVIGSKARFYIRSYKKAGGRYFYSPWVKMTL